MYAGLHRFSLCDIASGEDKSFGIIYANDFAGNPAQFECEASYGAADIKSANVARARNWQQAFLAEPLMKAQELLRHKIEPTQVLWLAVMKKEIFVQVALGFVKIGLHMATSLTKSVGS